MSELANTPVTQVDLDLKLTVDEINVVLFALNNTPMGNLSAASINALAGKINTQAAPQWEALQKPAEAPVDELTVQ